MTLGELEDLPARALLHPRMLATQWPHKWAAQVQVGSGRVYMGVLIEWARNTAIMQIQHEHTYSSELIRSECDKRNIYSRLETNNVTA